MNDLEFVRRCIDGEAQSRDEFCKNYSRLVYNYIYHVIKSKGCTSGQGQVEDIFQEFYCFLFDDDCRKLKTFKARNNSRFATWLRQVAINFTLDYLRTKRELLSLDEVGEEGESLGETVASVAPGAAEIAHDNEILKHLADCISRLGIDDKYFVKLHFVQGLKLNELMKLFGSSRGSMDMKKQRLLSRLRDCFLSKGIALDF